ncbi:hypothetical protein JVU11DRAFT_4263 [Chiua virens]|nr:hypothetical protein JVU11DRAFT_4263 [Chiua virens]
MEEDELYPQPRIINPSSAPRRTSDLFKKRPPTSPLPNPTPRKPSAPGRTKRGATPKPRSISFSESDPEDEDEPLSQSAAVPFLSLIPVAKSKPTKSKPKPTLTGKGRPRAAPQRQNPSTSSNSGSGSQNKRKKGHKRRLTLDEELRHAEGRSSDFDQCNDELEPEGKEDDVFTATGTRSKQQRVSRARRRRRGSCVYECWMCAGSDAGQCGRGRAHAGKTLETAI